MKSSRNKQLHAILSSMMKSHVVPLHPAPDMNHPFVHVFTLCTPPTLLIFSSSLGYQIKTNKQTNKQYRQGTVLSVTSGIHRGSWDISPWLREHYCHVTTAQCKTFYQTYGATEGDSSSESILRRLSQIGCMSRR